MNRCPTYIYHRIYCEYYNLESIPDGFCLHHIDGNSYNNNIDNLQLMTKSQHTILHNTNNKYCVGRKYEQSTIDKMSKSHLGKVNYTRKITEEMIEDQPHMNGRQFIQKYKCGIRIYYKIKSMKEILNIN